METLTQMKRLACRKEAPTVTYAEIAELEMQDFNPKVAGSIPARPITDIAQTMTTHRCAGNCVGQAGPGPSGGL
jgi:hypothetical protein